MLKRVISTGDGLTPSESQIERARPRWALPLKTTISRTTTSQRRGVWVPRAAYPETIGPFHASGRVEDGREDTRFGVSAGLRHDGREDTRFGIDQRGRGTSEVPQTSKGEGGAGEGTRFGVDH